MAILRLKTAIRTSCVTPILTAIDAGSGAGTIKIYSGTIPADIDTAPSGSNLILAELTFSDPCGTVTDGVLTMGAITQDSSANNTGLARWARILDSTGATVADVDVSSTGGGGTLQLNTVNIVAGGPVLITSFTVTVQ